MEAAEAHRCAGVPGAVGGGTSGGGSSGGGMINLSTDGIDMEEWSPSYGEDEGKPNLVFNIWDFAGQEV